nr:MAG TPA: hypothetical protein [Caudoviricetes sp.]
MFVNYSFSFKQICIIRLRVRVCMCAPVCACLCTCAYRVRVRSIIKKNIDCTFYPILCNFLFISLKYCTNKAILCNK